jgi:gas vesicle protein
MADNDSDFGAFLAGFLLGGLVGAGAALFLAPQSGEETREMVRERGIELKSRAEETATQLRSKAEVAFQEGRERVEEIIDTAKQRSSKRKPGAAEGQAPD